MTKVIVTVSLVLTLAGVVIAPQAAHSARICKSGHLYYSGSDFVAERSKAEASAVQAWRRIKARTEGADRASQMLPSNGQLHCERAATKVGWRCFVRGGPCHHT
jgi:hypothetical protein